MGEADEGVLERLESALARAERLPSPPTVAVEVLRLANDENATIEALAKVLSRDPALSARILKLANSSMFRRGDEVTSLHKATLRLGLKAVKLMALSFSLTQNLPRRGGSQGESAGFDYPGYWRRSLTMAVAGRALARLLRHPHGDEAFLCGLLGRFGQLVLVQCMPREYARVVERAEGELPAARLEAECLGYDFHQVGAALLRSWNLPELICQTLRHWGDPAALPAALGSSVQELTHIVHLADVTTSVICGSCKGAALQRLHELGAGLCGVSEAELDALVVSLERDVTEMASLLNCELDQDSYQDILDRARMEMVQLSLGTAADLAQTTSRALDLERRNEALTSLASTDPLTGIPNRAAFDQTLERVLRARLAGQSDKALGLLMLDVDHFKQFNDRHGHQVGDEVLKLVAGALAAATRETDIAARYGGEEFVVVLGNTTLEILESVGERIRRRIAASPLQRDGASLSVTVSVGGACLERVRALEDGAALLSVADACLYEAKRGGRDHCVCRQLESAGLRSSAG